MRSTQHKLSQTVYFLYFFFQIKIGVTFCLSYRALKKYISLYIFVILSLSSYITVHSISNFDLLHLSPLPHHRLSSLDTNHHVYFSQENEILEIFEIEIHIHTMFFSIES